MDRSRKASLLRIAALTGAMALGGLAVAEQPAVTLIAERWLASTTRTHAIAFEPVECLKPVDDAAARRKVMMGRAVFRTPLLLGGQAARLGLSCNSCHRNGRDNPHFLFPGLSDRPGTADVTSSLMSSYRGDGLSNPVPIPDLSGEHPTIARTNGPVLRRFVRGVIVEGFDGPEPSVLTLDALTAYLVMLDHDACPPSPEQPTRVSMYVGRARQAVQAAQFALDAGDGAAARLMLSSARGELGVIHDRYASGDLLRHRENLMGADLDLARIQKAIDRGEPGVSERIAAWLVKTPDWEEPLVRDEPQSLFNANGHASPQASEVRDYPGMRSRRSRLWR